MDLIPTPSQLVAAAGNVASKLLYGGLADLRPMPRTLIDEGTLREVYHYRPSGEIAESGDPVLLVTPLAAPSLCFDLRRDCSLVEHMVSLGRRTYLVEYGQVAFKDRGLGMEHWIDEVLPTAIREVSAHAGGRPVHVVGWSLGGIFALLTAADSPELPIASLSTIGSPVDVKKVPLMAPVRPLLNLAPGTAGITRAYRALGGVPQPLVNWAFSAVSAQKIVTKPLAIAMRLDDRDFLAQLEAVGVFMDNMYAYPGRSFGQLFHRFVRGNQLQGGAMEFGDRTIHLAQVKAPTLVFAGATDGIAPVNAVRPVTDLLSSAPEVRFEIVPGGHLGMLTGRAARATTWEALDEWIDQWSTRAPAQRTTRRTGSAKKAGASKTTKKAAAKKTTATKSAAKASATKKTASKRASSKKSTPTTSTATKKTAATRKTTAKKAATKTATKTPTTKKATTKRTGAKRESIGSNPTRRYSSAGSRALSKD